MPYKIYIYQTAGGELTLLASDALITALIHLPVSTGWKPQSMFSSRWWQSSIIHWMVRLLNTWLQFYAIRLTCRPYDVCGHHSPISSISASCSVQLLENELSLWLVLDYGTVCHQILLCVSHCHDSVKNSKHVYLDSHITLVSTSFSSWSLQFLLVPR